MKIKNWDKWQTYRKDRGSPPWIKVHRNLMTNPEWAALSDAEKGQLISIWIVAADKGGEIPDNPQVLRKVAMLDDVPNLNKFIELGFIESTGCQTDVKPTPSERRSDAPETETETEEIRGEKNIDDSAESPSTTPKWTQEDKNLAVTMLRWVQEIAPSAKASKKWPDDIRLMRERDGHTLEEIREMFQFANKHDFWKANILSPATLRKQWPKLEAEQARQKPSKPDWASIPQADDDLWGWAKTHGYRAPGQMTYRQYRTALQQDVEKRIAQNMH